MEEEEDDVDGGDERRRERGDGRSYAKYGSRELRIRTPPSAVPPSLFASLLTLTPRLCTDSFVRRKSMLAFFVLRH